MLDDFCKLSDITARNPFRSSDKPWIQKRQELVNKHAGNPRESGEVGKSTDNLVSQYTKSAIGTKIKADQELMVRTLNQQKTVRA